MIPYQANSEDIEFANKIHFFVKQRETTLNAINRLLEEGIEVPTTKVTGIRQLRLTWKKPIKGFEGSGHFFYRVQVTEKRPYLRLIPAEGSAITKLHVKGALPIPTLEDPRILEVWGKEVSMSPGIDFCSMKYVHRPSIGITQPVYGTVQVFNDGTLNLLLLPPKQIRKLDPILDFRNFNTILENVFTGLPQSYDSFELGEIAVLFALKIGVKSKKFNKVRIQQRLPFFQTFFTEIKPLPNESPVISLRYKAVSQYATEDKIFSFLTQYATNKILEGEESPDIQVIRDLQNEFKISKKEAIEIYAEWYKKRGTFTVQIPEEGEFIESFNPGIDIHIFAQHPSYYFHINRIDSHETYVRIFTLLSLLFVEDDEYFMRVQNSSLTSVSNEIERESLMREEGNIFNSEETTEEDTAANASIKNAVQPQEGTASGVPDWMIDDPFAEEANAVNVGEVLPETAPSPVQAATVPQETIASKQRPPLAVTTTTEEKSPQRPLVPLMGEDEQRLVDPKSWFIKKLQEIDSRLFVFKTEDDDENGYSRKCGGHDDRQPSILTRDQYERMREIYENDPIFGLYILLKVQMNRYSHLVLKKL